METPESEANMPATLNDIQAKYGDSVYPLYKDQMHEPYMENNNGLGYQGVVMYDEIDDKIQCSKCGSWLKRITPAHLRKCGNFENIWEYKKEYGLNIGTPLNSIKYSQNRSNIMTDLRNKGVLSTNTLTKKIRNKAIKNSVNVRKGRYQSMQTKNFNGYCDAQILTLLNIVKNRFGHLGYSEVKKDNPNLCGVLDERRKRGQKSWDYYFKEMKKNGTEIKSKNSRYTTSSYIAKMRDLVARFHRMPTKKEFSNNKIHTSTAYYLFGSWSRAKMMAGLDQLLQEVRQNET